MLVLCKPFRPYLRFIKVKIKVKVKVWTLVIAPLTRVRLVTNSALQSVFEHLKCYNCLWVRH